MRQRDAAVAVNVTFNAGENPLLFNRSLICPSDPPTMDSVSFGSGTPPAYNNTWIGYVCNPGATIIIDTAKPGCNSDQPSQGVCLKNYSGRT